MANRTLIVAALCAAMATPVSAGVAVFGESNARLCFEAAESPLMPQMRDIQRCDEALTRENLSQYDIVATHVNRGVLRLRQNRVADAVADFDSAIRLNPNEPEAYLNKGAAMIRRQDAAGAVQLFTVALERNTRRPAVALYGRAVANEAMGNIPAAYQDFRRASELAPEWREPQLELARFRVGGQ